MDGVANTARWGWSARSSRIAPRFSIAAAALFHRSFVMELTVEIAPASRMSDAPPLEGDNRPLQGARNHDKAPAVSNAQAGQE